MKNNENEKTWNKWTTVSIIGILIGIILICFFSMLSVVCAYVGGGILVISIILGCLSGNMGRGTGISDKQDDSINVNVNITYNKKD